MSAVHQNATTRTAEENFPRRYLLVKKGSAARSILINTEGDRPLGVCPDKPDTGDEAAVQFLSATMETRKMVPGGEIAEDAEVFGADDGEVTELPVADGTYYKVGRALQAVGADADSIEVEPCYPVAVEVAA